MPKHRKLLENFENSWWRYDLYEVRAHCIAPQRHAKLARYDPWNVKREGDHAVIHDALDDLLTLFSTSLEYKLSTRAVLEWCSAYGPLGILTHQTVAVRLPPRKLALPADHDKLATYARTTGVADPNEFIAQHAGLKVPELRFQGAWFKQEHFLMAGFDPTELQPSEATLRSSENPANPFVTKSIEDAWGPYFPDVALEARREFPYPVPESTAFALAYCEPLQEWIRWAQKLCGAVAELRAKNNAQQWNRGSATLSELAQPVAPMMRLSPRNEVQFAWRSPSLLGSLALVAMQRLTAKRAQLCKDPACGRVFIQSNPRAEYHKDACRWRHHQELGRARSKPRKKQTRRREARKET